MLAISVLLRSKPIPQDGPLQRGRINFGADSTTSCDYSTNNALAITSALNTAGQPIHILALCLGRNGGSVTDQGAVFTVENPTTSSGFTSHAFLYLNHPSSANTPTTVFMLRGDSTATTTSYQVGSPANSFPPNVFGLAEGIYDGNTITARSGAASNSANTPSDGAMTGADTIRIGARLTTSGKARQIAGCISELIVCNGVLTTQERGQLVAWLNAQYGTNLT